MGKRPALRRKTFQPTAPGSSAALDPRAPGPAWIPWVLGPLLLLAAAFYYAVPVEDGDLFFHMAYGRQILERHSLLPDHTAFSWTPTDGSGPYCNWLSELALYGLHAWGGLNSLFALRYLCVASLLAVGIFMAHRRAQLRNPLVWLALLTAVPMTVTGAIVKPEMFSVVLMALVSAVWFWIKQNPESEKAAYAWPVLTVIWVNTHGAFTFGLAFLALAAAGETLAFLLARRSALPVTCLRHLLAGVALSFAATLATPYGVAYPLALLKRFMVGDPLLSSVLAYLSVFDPAVSGLGLVACLLIGATVLLALLLMSRPIDLAVAMVNLAMALLYARISRTSYLWAPILVLSVVHLSWEGQRHAPWPRHRRLTILAASLAGVLYLGVWVAQVVSNLGIQRQFLWSGFGISYFNPVVEARFVEELPVVNIGTDYDTGAYLLWKLYPGKRVLVDSRYFPYRSWFPAYRRFELGEDFEEFLHRFRCDAFVVHLRRKKLVENFLASRDWRLGFYGPTAAVFVRSDVPVPTDLRQYTETRFDDVRNFGAAYAAFELALNISDFTGAARLLQGIDARFASSLGQADLTSLRNLFTIRLCGRRTQLLAAAHEYGAAYRETQRVLSLDPTNAHALFNAGSLGWALAPEGSSRSEAIRSTGSSGWRAPLEKFVELYGGNTAVPADILKDARDLLAGTFHGAPPTVGLDVPPAASHGGFGRLPAGG